MGVVSISMPDALLERVDAFVDEHGYSGRSEAVRQGTRSLLGEFQTGAADDRRHVGTVTVVFEYCQPVVQQRARLDRLRDYPYACRGPILCGAVRSGRDHGNDIHVRQHRTGGTGRSVGELLHHHAWQGEPRWIHTVALVFDEEHQFNPTH